MGPTALRHLRKRCSLTIQNVSRMEWKSGNWHAASYQPNCNFDNFPRITCTRLLTEPGPLVWLKTNHYTLHENVLHLLKAYIFLTIMQLLSGIRSSACKFCNFIVRQWPVYWNKSSDHYLGEIYLFRFTRNNNRNVCIKSTKNCIILVYYNMQGCSISFQ